MITVHHGESESAIGSGIDWQIPVRTSCGARAVGIDHDQLRAVAPRLAMKGQR